MQTVLCLAAERRRTNRHNDDHEEGQNHPGANCTSRSSRDAFDGGTHTHVGLMHLEPHRINLDNVLNRSSTVNSVRLCFAGLRSLVGPAPGKALPSFRGVWYSVL